MAETHIGFGESAATIIDVVRRDSIDTLVVGRRERGQLDSLLLGSVPQKLVTLAPCIVIVFGFAGLSLQSDQIAINPKLPAKWRSLGFGIEWRGRRLKFRIDTDHELLQATLEAGDSMTFLVNGRQHEVRCDQAAVCPL